MSTQQWPPANWPFPVSDLGYYSIIPMIDAAQWVYDSLTELVNALPHQESALERDVNGMINAITGTKEFIKLGTVGYDAKTRKVSMTTNAYGGFSEQTLEMDISMVLPMVTVLVSRIPWDVVGEMNTAITNGMTDAEKAKYASSTTTSNTMLMQWLLGKVRTAVSDNLTVAIPALEGDYATNTQIEGTKIIPSVSDLVLYNIPTIDYCQAIYDAVIELIDTINHHPPAKTWPVITQGAVPLIRYGLDDQEVVTDMPALSDLPGHTLRISAIFKADNTVFDNSVSSECEDYPVQIPLEDGSSTELVLIEKTFAPNILEITYKSTTMATEENIVAGQTVALITTGISVTASVLSITQGVVDESETEIIVQVTTEANSVASGSDTVDISSSLTTGKLYTGAAQAVIVATEVGKQVSISIGDTATLSTPITGISAVVRSLETGGSTASTIDTAPGDAKGSRARGTILLYNTSDEAIAFTRDNVPKTVVINGTTCNVNELSLIGQSIPAASTLEYTATANGDTTLGFAPTEIDFNVAIPLYNSHVLVRWFDLADLIYIGKEFNIEIGTLGGGVQRYIIGRLMCVMDGDSNYTYTYTDEADVQLCPAANCHPMDISYNAVSKSITIENLYTGDSVQLRLNAAIWFALQLVMLIPITVI